MIIVLLSLQNLLISLIGYLYELLKATCDKTIIPLFFIPILEKFIAKSKQSFLDEAKDDKD